MPEPEDEIVIYKRGEVATPPPMPIPKRIPPELLQIIVLDDIQVALTKINKHLEKAEFEGYLDPRVLSVSEETQGISLINDWPFTPWVSASFFNDGDVSTDPPGEVTVYIAVNLTFDWVPLKKGESIDMDFPKSDKRIQFIHHRCDTGKTASVRVVGKY